MRVDEVVEINIKVDCSALKGDRDEERRCGRRWWKRGWAVVGMKVEMTIRR